jgi:hypothetical protein
VFENDTDIPTIEGAAKLYGKTTHRNVVDMFLNVNQSAPCFGFGTRPDKKVESRGVTREED